MAVRLCLVAFGVGLEPLIAGTMVGVEIRRGHHYTICMGVGCSPIFDFEKNSSNSLQGLELRLKSRGYVCAPFGATVPLASQHVIHELVTATDRRAKSGAVGATVAEFYRHCPVNTVTIICWLSR